MYQPNLLKSIVLPVPEIIALEFLVGVVNPNLKRRGGRGRAGMVPFKRALLSSYRPSIVTYCFPLCQVFMCIVLFSVKI